MDPLWITYAWKDDEGGDFSWLVQELEALGITVIYDKRALIPGRRLWGQIGRKITRSPLSGCAFLLTPNSLNREGCKEELEYAVSRALKAKGE
ncbi:MAG: toll/interleukin-1 receptor domain-containing protein, partial [Chloroflexi bacterium]|nr:toll/interleukin-1 receptor domain-containing protein [Chloroflexota bacterium]